MNALLMQTGKTQKRRKPATIEIAIHLQEKGGANVSEIG